MLKPAELYFLLVTQAADLSSRCLSFIYQLAGWKDFLHMSGKIKS